jgi:hypothetical protein
VLEEVPTGVAGSGGCSYAFRKFQNNA